MKFNAIPVGELHPNHIRSRDADRLNDLADRRFAEVSVADFDTGWFVQVGGYGPNDPLDLKETNDTILKAYVEADMSADFIRIVEAAQAAGLAFLRVHVDAEPTEGLPVFDW
jgi:hypothetical protein